MLESKELAEEGEEGGKRKGIQTFFGTIRRRRKKGALGTGGKKRSEKKKMGQSDSYARAWRRKKKSVRE